MIQGLLVKVEAGYREITRRWHRIPGSRGDITHRSEELTVRRTHRERVQEKVERTAKGRSQPAVTSCGRSKKNKYPDLSLLA